MGGTQTALSGSETMLIGLVVGLVLIPSLTWPLVQHFQVMAHEGMHGMVGSLSRKVEWIELKEDASGRTRIVPPSGCGFLVAAFVGYLGPSAFGLGASRLIQYGHIIVVLWLAMLFLGLLLIMLKPSFGYVTVPLAGLLIFLVLKHTSQATQIVAAYAIAWFLLLSGVRIVVQRNVNAGDAGILNDATSIPKLVWFGLWLAGTLAAVVIGARWMLHPVVSPATVS
jgi:Peptidase M50B-like